MSTTSNTHDRALGRVEGKIDIIISMIGDRKKEHTALVKRVTKLEIAMASLLAAGGLYGAHSYGILSAAARAFH